ncbi:MAG: sensor histidine kinase, partial [Planctomycetota bacterium]
DRGIGIPESERERVFESFIRGSNAGEARGSGLGLSLVRHFARAHGGDAEAEPREGGGTVLRLTLPRVSLSAVEEVPDEPHAARVPAMRTLR